MGILYGDPEWGSCMSLGHHSASLEPGSAGWSWSALVPSFSPAMPSKLASPDISRLLCSVPPSGQHGPGLDTTMASWLFLCLHSVLGSSCSTSASRIFYKLFPSRHTNSLCCWLPHTRGMNSESGLLTETSTI